MFEIGKERLEADRSMMPIGLYIHIPFCKSRCIYCDFYSSVMTGLQDTYIDAVCREMEMRRKELIGHELQTIYLGGGTPSQLTKQNLSRIFNTIAAEYGSFMSDDMEVTMECNPDDVTTDFVHNLESLPVNRVSLGAQTFNDVRLKLLQRRHSADDVVKAVGRLRSVGIRNISVDLMFGFPQQTPDDWERDIDAALALDVEHLSAYMLMYEAGTPMTKMVERGIIKPLDDDKTVSMYEQLNSSLSAAGYEHYEISNWAKPGFSSRHNSCYWQGIPYVGIGAAAHSYNLSTRSWNVADLKAYIESIGNGIRPFEDELIDEVTRYNDMIATTMRTKNGVNVSSLKDIFRNYLLASAKTAIDEGLLILENGYLHLTSRGILVSDSVFSNLIMVVD